jgi:hypothetical protein
MGTSRIREAPASRAIERAGGGVVTVADPTTEERLKAREELLAKGQAFATENRRHPTIYLRCDLAAELRRFWRLPALQRWPRSPAPELRVRYSSVKHGPKWVSGLAEEGRRRIVLTIGCGAELSSVLETLLHEAVHLSLPGDSHSHRFILRLVRAAAEAWSIDIPKPLETTEVSYHRKLAYAVDARVVAELQAVFDCGCFLPPAVDPPPPAAKEPASERSDRLRRERAEHALAMLTKNERKLKRFQTIVKGWRAKVRYYEKVAAKRGTPTS